MAREATTFKAFNQALIYLKQATRLCTLLADDDRVEQALNYNHVIETLHAVVLNERTRDSQTIRPQLPQRESLVREETRVQRIRVPRPIPDDYDPYKNCARARQEATTNAPSANPVHPAVERIVANQQQLQCEIHAAPSSELSDDAPQVIPVPRTPAQPTRAVRFIRRSVDEYTSDDGDSVCSVPPAITVTPTIEDVFTAF